MSGILCGYQSTRHTVNSPHGQLVTPAKSTRHRVNSSHMRLITESTRHKWAQNKTTNRNSLFVGQVAPRNSAAFTNHNRRTTTQNKHKKIKLGLVASYNIRQGNGEGSFWFRHFIKLSLTSIYLLRHLPPCLDPGPTGGRRQLTLLLMLGKKKYGQLATVT